MLLSLAAEPGLPASQITEEPICEPKDDDTQWESLKIREQRTHIIFHKCLNLRLSQGRSSDYVQAGVVRTLIYSIFEMSS